MTIKPTNILFPIVQWVDSFTFLTKTGHVGIVLQHKGIDSECINDAIAESYTARFRRAMKSFTDDFQIFQYVLKHDGAEILVSDHYVNELAGTAAKARKAFLESRPDGLYQSELFLCFLYKPKNISSQPRPRGGISISLKQTKRLRLLARELDRNRRALFIRAKSFIAEVGDLLAPRILSKEEAYLFFRRLANFDPKLAAAIPLTSDIDIDQRLSNLHIYCNPDGISTNNRYLRVLSMKETPISSGPNMLKDLYRIRANFFLCLQYEPYTHEASVKEIASATHHFNYAQFMQSLGHLFTMVTNKFSGKSETENILKDEGAADNLAEVNELSKALNTDDVLGELCFTLVLHDSDQAKLDYAAAEAIRAMGQHEASMFLETYNSRDGYLGIFPGNKEYTADRSYLVLRSTVADMSLIYGKSNGEVKNTYLGTEYLFAAEISESEGYYVSTNYNDVNNLFMSGMTGAGKSVLSNKLIEGNLKNGAHVLVLDEGHSYRELCDKHRGAYFHFDFDKQDFFINPFILPGTRTNIRFLTTFVRLLLRNNGYNPTLDDNRTIYEGIIDLYEKGERADRRLRNVAMRREARLALSNWIQDGEDAWLFDNVDDSITFNKFQVFEFQGAEEDEMSTFLEPLQFYLFKRWGQMAQDPALLHVQKVLHLDEAHKRLLNETVRRKVVSFGKQLRKYNGGIYIVTQSPEDLRRVGLLEVINELCPTKMWLSNPNADITEYTRIFGWNEAEAEAFQRLAPKRDVMVKKGERPAEIFHVNLSPDDILAVGNDPVGNMKREAVKRGRRRALAVGKGA